jgi:hypothetical protein
VNLPFTGGAADGAIGTTFTFTVTTYNTNLACWQGVGLPKGLNPTVGQAFIATTSGVSTGGGSTGQVKAPGVSGISNIEIVGLPSTALACGPQGSLQQGGSGNTGGWLLMQCVLDGVVTQPNAGTLVNIGFYVEGSSEIIAGE